jgi:hypothetical protein
MTVPPVMAIHKIAASALGRNRVVVDAEGMITGLAGTIHNPTSIKYIKACCRLLKAVN